MKKLIKVISIVLLSLSIVIALYPTLSNEINKLLDKAEINNYTNDIKSINDKDKEKYFSDAKEYNDNLDELVSINGAFTIDAYDIKPGYDEVLNIGDKSLIGTIDIEKINVHLPIYHGTNEKNLNYGAVHMANTSFPIGGKSTHSVISAHTAYPGKIFFDNLTKLEYGDKFSITVLDRKLYYEVEEINIVTPDDTSLLKIRKGEDLVTLVTCTPYSVNTHRLLVTGKRTSVSIQDDNKTTQESFAIYIYIALGVLVFTIVVVIIRKRRKNAQKTKYKNKNTT